MPPASAGPARPAGDRCTHEPAGAGGASRLVASNETLDIVTSAAIHQHAAADAEYRSGAPARRCRCACPPLIVRFWKNTVRLLVPQAQAEDLEISARTVRRDDRFPFAHSR